MTFPITVMMHFLLLRAHCFVEKLIRAVGFFRFDQNKALLLPGLFIFITVVIICCPQRLETCVQTVYVVIAFFSSISVYCVYMQSPNHWGGKKPRFHDCTQCTVLKREPSYAGATIFRYSVRVKLILLDALSLR